MLTGFIIGILVSFVVYSIFITFGYKHKDYGFLLEDMYEKEHARSESFMGMFIYLYNKFKPQLTVDDILHLDSILDKNKKD